MLRGHEKLKKGSLVAFLSLFIVVLDYISKRLIVSHIMFHQHIAVFPFLRIVHVENRGAAFGLFAHFGNNFFILISVCAIICIGIYIIRLPIGMELLAMSLILGGAAGNLIDRLRGGKVIDFIDLYIGEWHWPAFNIADSALTVGIILYVMVSISRGKGPSNPAGAEKDEGR